MTTVELIAECDRLRRERDALAAKLAAAQAALREQIKRCRPCEGKGKRSTPYLDGSCNWYECNVCKPIRDLLREQGAES